MLPNKLNVWDATHSAPGVQSAFISSTAGPSNATPASNNVTSKRDRCLQFVRDYYRENYRVLKSKHGNKCVLYDIERVLGVHPKASQDGLPTKGVSDAVEQLFEGEDHAPMEVYGHWGSALPRRPTRRRHIPPRIYEDYQD